MNFTNPKGVNIVETLWRITLLRKGGITDKFEYLGFIIHYLKKSSVGGLDR